METLESQNPINSINRISSPNQEFVLPFLIEKKKNRYAAYLSFTSFSVLLIIFAVMTSFTPNGYRITGIIISVVGMLISLFRFFVHSLGFVQSTSRFVKTLVFIWEFFFALVCTLLFVESVMVIGLILVMSALWGIITVVQIQTKYAKYFKNIFEDDEMEEDVLV